MIEIWSYRRGALDRVLARAAVEGRLKYHGDDDGPRDPWAFIRSVKALLRRSEY